MAKGPLKYTTSIPANQTIVECQSALAAAGAASVSVHFEDGQPAGLSFSLKTPHGPRNFTLPVNIDGMQAVLRKAAKPGGSLDALHTTRAKLDHYVSREHAANVAWRVVKDWLEAVLALIAAGMSSIDEIMLPYLHIQIGGEEKVLWQHYRDQERAALLPGSDRG
jgi:hypothetical protein